MERLTEYENGRARIKTNSPLAFSVTDYRSCVDRLAAIEDILGPDYDLKRLRELVSADREGRCIVTPYRIPGDAYINHDDVTLYKRMLGGEMTEIEVSELYVSEDGTCDFEPVGEGHDGVVYGLKDMGITIFTELEG